ncbi:SRPBCC domain-containing protein [bacterium]|nr:SRPBCC domain-containing protein [bacterium]
MRELRTEIHINATPDEVWEEFKDFDSYHSWNPFIKQIKGEVEEGKKFGVELQPPGGQKMAFKPKCLEFRPGKLRWLGHLGMKGIFDGEHIFELEKQEFGTLFIQREKFKGVLIPLVWKQLDTQTRKGFEAMNLALKERVENKTKES